MSLFGDMERCKETSTTTGTGTYSTTPAVGFNTFVQAVGAGNECYYYAIDNAGAGYELNYGIPSAGSLTRETIRSSNSNNPVSWVPGTRTLYIAPPAVALNAMLDSMLGQPLLRNAAFAIKQRLATTIADAAYGHDGWYALTQSADITVSTLTNVEDGMPTMARLTQPAVEAQRMGYAQAIEGKLCKHLRGKQVTFRFGRFRCSVSQAIRFAVLEWTGTEDAITRDVVNDWTSAVYSTGNFFAAANLIVSGVTSNVPAAATLTNGPRLTVTLGSTFNNLIVLAWSEGTLAQNATLDLGKTKLEQGPVPTPFVPYPYPLDLAFCQRYLPSWTAPSGGNIAVANGKCDGTTSASISFPFKVAPRIPPTGVTLSNNAHFGVTAAGGAIINAAAITFVAGGESIGMFSIGVAAGLVAGDATNLFSQNAAAQILFTGAEL